MIRVLICLLFLFVLGCDANLEVEKGEKDCEFDLGIRDASIDVGGWLCWNPDSDLHGRSCSSRCMVPGNRNTFCYQPEEE